MAKNTQSRKWQLTINNPKENNAGREVIKNKLNEFTNLVYYCIADEIGENGTYHTHIFLQTKSPVRFTTLKNRFPTAHFEMARGTAKENREYVFKIGKWADDKKADTALPETQEEYGDLPIERQGQRNDLIDLYDMIKDDKSNYEIIEENTNFIFDIDKIERARQIVREEKFKNTFRDLETIYIYGDTGTGKTRGVMEKYGYSNVYRVTDYDNPFDSYKGQDVIIFEEFRSQLKISEMLNYLDGYPLELPARYANKIACFTKVYLITNIPLNEQYRYLQEEQPETFNAFLRRINEVQHYTKGQIKSLLPHECIKNTNKKDTRQSVLNIQKYQKS